MMTPKAMKVAFLAATVVGILVVLYFVTQSNPLLISGFQSGSDEPTFTMYYADWCPHCQTAKPDFEKLVGMSPLKVGNTNCRIEMVSPEKEPERAAGKAVKGYPTFLFEKAGGGTVEYKGPRNADGYLAFLNEQLGGGV